MVMNSGKRKGESPAQGGSNKGKKECSVVKRFLCLTQSGENRVVLLSDESALLFHALTHTVIVIDRQMTHIHLFCGGDTVDQIGNQLLMSEEPMVDLQFKCNI